MRSNAFAMLGAILALVFGAGQLHAAQPTKKPAAAPDTRKTIGLISELGDTMSIQQIGIMVFGNAKISVPIENWGIDALVYAKASSMVKARFNVIPVNLSKEGRSAVAAAPGSLFGDRAAYICNVLKKETQGRAFTYYLRVTPRESNFGNTNQTLSGLGVLHRQGLSDGYTFVHALFSLEVLDGSNCAHIHTEDPAGNNGFSLFSPAYFDGLSREVDASWMVEPAKAPQDGRLRDAVKELVEQGMTQSMPRLFATQP